MLIKESYTPAKLVLLILGFKLWFPTIRGEVLTDLKEHHDKKIKFG